jgi:hypothetical protein
VGRLVRSAILGALAGAAGTAAMDALWYRRARRGGSTQGPMQWEFAAGTSSWDDVSAPGKVGHLVLEKMTGGEPPDTWARSTQNAVHWLTGIAWGAQLGAGLSRARRPRWWWGLGLGATAWGTSYAVLPKVDIYKPIGEYDARTLAQDLSAHLLYGAVAGITYAAAARRT